MRYGARAAAAAAVLVVGWRCAGVGAWLVCAVDAAAEAGGGGAPKGDMRGRGAMVAAGPTCWRVVVPVGVVTVMVLDWFAWTL